MNVDRFSTHTALSELPYTLGMKKTMEVVTVKTDGTHIIIEQESEVDPELSQTIEVSPDQIPILIQWLEEARKEFASPNGGPK
jgi:hypothetical protein